MEKQLSNDKLNGTIGEDNLIKTINEVISSNRILITGPFSIDEFNNQCCALDTSGNVRYIGLVEGDSEYFVIIIPYVQQPINLSQGYMISVVRDYFANRYNDKKMVNDVIKYLLILTYVDGVIRPQNLYSLARIYDSNGDRLAAFSAIYACYIAILN